MAVLMATTSLPSPVSEMDGNSLNYMARNATDIYNQVNFDFNMTERRPTLAFRPRKYPAMDPMILKLIQLQYYGYPVLLTIGTLGNILAYIVFTRTKFKKVSSAHYLAAVAITDTGFLWTSFLTPLYEFYQVPIIVQDGLCQFMTFLNYVFTFLSIWYFVALVIDKFIVVYLPLQKSTMCTPFRAKLVMSFLAVVTVACYSYVVYFFGPDEFQGILRCMPWKELRIHFGNLSKIDTIVVAIIPYCLIVIFSALIVIRGCEYYRISASVDSVRRQDQTGRIATHTSVHITKVIYPVVVLTIITNVPIMMIRAAVTLQLVQRAGMAKWQLLFYVLYIINFAIKYFVYTLFSGSFRRRTCEVLQLTFAKIKRKCRCYSSSLENDPHRITMEPVLHENGKQASNVKTDI